MVSSTLKKLLNSAVYTLSICFGSDCQVCLLNLLLQHICYCITFSRKGDQFILVSALWAFVQDLLQFANEQHHLFAQHSFVSNYTVVIKYFFVFFFGWSLRTCWSWHFRCSLLAILFQDKQDVSMQWREKERVESHQLGVVSENKDLPVILFLPFWNWVFNGQSSELGCAPDININFDWYSSRRRAWEGIRASSFLISRQGRSTDEFYELHITSLTFLQVEVGAYLPFNLVSSGLQLLEDKSNKYNDTLLKCLWNEK